MTVQNNPHFLEAYEGDGDFVEFHFERQFCVTSKVELWKE